MRNKVLNGIVMSAVMIGLAMPAFAAVKKPPKGNKYSTATDSQVVAAVKKPPKSNS